jgi:putative oxidoreductase
MADERARCAHPPYPGECQMSRSSMGQPQVSSVWSWESVREQANRERQAREARATHPTVSDSGGDAWPVVGTPLSRVRHVLQRLRASRDTRGARDLALLAVRTGLAWIFIYHGASTLFGAFGGSGIHGQTAFFESVAHLHPAKFFAVLSGIIEFFGGIGVGVGFLGRLAALGLFGDMVIAMVTVTWRNGIVSSAVGGGYELNVALAALALGVAILGTGDISLDAALGSLATRWRRSR